MEQITKMRIFGLSKRGNTFVIISMIMTAVLAGTTVLTGTLIANNIKNQQSISYQEAIDIASSIPKVAVFIEENDITSVSADLYDNVWIVEFFAGNVNYTEDFYCWLNYAHVEIDATTGEVLYYEVYSPSTPNWIETNFTSWSLGIGKAMYLKAIIDTSTVGSISGNISIQFSIDAFPLEISVAGQISKVSNLAIIILF